MELLASSPPFIFNKNLKPHPSLHTPKFISSQVLLWKFRVSRIVGDGFRNRLLSLEYDVNGGRKGCKSLKIGAGAFTSCSSFFQPFRKLQSFTSRSWSLLLCTGATKFRECATSHKVLNWKERFKSRFFVLFFQLAIGMVLIMSLSVAVSKTPSWALTEENLLFLEAWRTIDRAYFDKTFNGQSWFRYRESALRNERMNTREETYMAIKKMLATLDDPFTRFLEPDKFKSLRSGTQGSLTGVGLSIGYPTGIDGSPSGLIVISSSPGGPAERAGIMPGDVILSIDNTSTETMGLYDAAERLQGPEGSLVELAIHNGPEIKQVSLKRERVSLNPVKSRLCEVQSSGKDRSRIGYIKLTSFNQNASGG